MNSSNDLLQAAYNELDFTRGALVDTTSEPDYTRLNNGETNDPDGNRGGWLDNGEWLSLAKSVGVEKVFFVDNNPVIVFASFAVDEDNDEADSLRTRFNRIWCMSRPQLLFLAHDGELAVCDLTKPPMRPSEDLSDNQRCLKIARSVGEVQTKLKEYHRSQVESGRLFEEFRFGSPSNRADESLIRDLKVVRKSLIDLGLSKQYAHRLIGRSIFIRYLEDRKVLIPEYFETIAQEKPEWQEIIHTPLPVTDEDSQIKDLLYLRVLSDKGFTYALFSRLARDFHGDMFPLDGDEENEVKLLHLKALQDLLCGDVDPQSKLFFFAYKFDIIPIELISSIYEEFYNAQHGKENNQGSHYTPSSLVEFLLSRILTPSILATKPRIMDPACGSGIFLVEAFRRLVRYQVFVKKNLLSRDDLLAILRDQIRGIDINDEAVHIAAFSLYLAYLHYQKPSDILKNLQLPHLQYQSDKIEGHQYFDVLLVANAFDLDTITVNLEDGVRHKFSSKCADVVIGNPPWGYPNRNDAKGREEVKVALAWCRELDRSVGDKELSQAFIHRTMDLLDEGGYAGLLVSSGVFFKRHPLSQRFRQQWLLQSKLINVVNFSHVRDIFFSGSGRGTNAIAPFVSVIFKKTKFEDNDHLIQYWSAKKTAFAKHSRSVILSKVDLKQVVQIDAMKDDTIWKIYWWGNHRDHALVQSLRLNPPLSSLGALKDDKGIVFGQGFKEANKALKSDWLKNYREFPAKQLSRYGQVSPSDLQDVPPKVESRGTEEIYNGTRLLVGRGIEQRGRVNGRIVARLEDQAFCFRNSINGIRLLGFEEWEQKTLLGILWSNLARYYFWLTAGSWGMWHHELQPDALMSLPVRFPKDEKLRSRIVSIVNSLQESANNTGQTVIDMQVDSQMSLFSEAASSVIPPTNSKTIEELERDLDEAIFELYGLNRAEKDLIWDMCDVGLEFFYQHIKSEAAKVLKVEDPARNYGVIKELSGENERGCLTPYLRTFLRAWNNEMEPDGEFRWRVIRNWQLIRQGKNPPMIAVVFSTQYKNEPLPAPTQSDSDGWSDVLRQIGDNSLHPYGSFDIYIDGIVRILSGANIIIIKRNHQRLWTPSTAREDAEATMLQAMQFEDGRLN